MTANGHNLLTVSGGPPTLGQREELRSSFFRHVTGIRYNEPDNAADRLGNLLLRLEQRLVAPRELWGRYQVFKSPNNWERMILLALATDSVWATRAPLSESEWKRAVKCARKLTRGGRQAMLLPRRPEFNIEEFARRADQWSIGIAFANSPQSGP